MTSQAVVQPDDNQANVTAEYLKNLTPQRDPGQEARVRLQNRAKKIKVTMARIYMGFTLMVFIALAAVVYYGYDQYKTSAVRYVDYRPCQYVNEKHGVEITGRREFSYMQHSILGIQIRDSKAIDEKTQIDVRGDAMTIVGMNGKEWWSVFVDMGERGIQMLNPAETYIVTTKGKAAVIDYAAFCR